MQPIRTLLPAALALTASLSHAMPDTAAPRKFLTLDPGHFHAALVQKTMYPGVSADVHVYAPPGRDVALHLARVDGYNRRKEDPTRWNPVTYEGGDFFERMLAERRGDIVVLAGNNRKKTDYILESIKAGFHVYADKPMAIDPSGFPKLQEAFRLARRKRLLLYDIMTERYEITTILQKELAQIGEVFGALEKGSPGNPSVTKESVHHFYKEVSGSPLQRPGWFYDIEQEGAGIVDVTTHLVDLVQWEAFPGQAIDYRKDIHLLGARRWNTALTLPEFRASTTLEAFPEYLGKYIDAKGALQVACNGEIDYVIKGVHARVSVIWNYRAEPGGGDTHFSVMKGTRSDLVIRQGRETGFQPRLYIEWKGAREGATVESAFRSLEARYPGISLSPDAKGWEVVIPASYREGHEAHFARVTEKYLGFLKSGDMPSWEVPNMIAKYYVTTEAFRMSGKAQ